MEEEKERNLKPEEVSRPEPIAITGIGCRFPGADGPEELWQLLREGRDAIAEIPQDRLDIAALYDPRPGEPGRICTRHGGFLPDVDRFDAAFFGISPREAVRMDPQHRLLLEVSWEALEDAGQTSERLAGSPVGVYVGMCYNDYEDLQFSDPATLDVYGLTGGFRSAAAGRLAHALGIGGPAFSVDAACASSLIATYLACLGLWSGDCTLALAGGANLILEPQVSIGFSRAGMLAPDGRCKFCDSRADGFVRSEGVGVLVLKPLSAALADGDPVYAVILGGATNNDGASGGSMMTPGRGGQEALLRAACERAGVAPGEVQYVEAHGTGTKVGDPVEIGALGAVLGEGRSLEAPLLVGSVKSNIGHTEGAAGIAGLIKAALSLKHGEIPPSLHVREPNPAIPWGELPVRVQRELGPWPASQGPRRAGVSSFGINGSNAHLVLEEAPAAAVLAARVEERDRGPWLFPLSARSPEALAALARSWAGALASPPLATAAFRDLGYTASRRRSHHEHRLAVAARSHDELRDSLEAFAQGETRSGLASGRALPGRRPKVAFVFPGQGSQWLGMGRELMTREPVFRQAIEECDRAIREEAGWSLLAELEADPAGSRLDQVDVIQPALFALQVGLAALWRSWGVEPDAVIGQSMGEVAASCVAGALSLEDATRVICRRSQLVKSASGQGGMAVVELSLEAAQRELAGREAWVSVAVSNGPESTVLSGDPAVLGEILAGLEARSVFCRWVKVDYASHSPQMDPLRADLLRLLDGVAPRPASVPVYSTVTGEISDGGGFDAAYWVSNLREPVLFAGSLRKMLADGFDAFVEVSPHPIVVSSVQQCLHHWGLQAAMLPSARREEEAAVLLGSLGALYAAGYPVTWDRLHPSGLCSPLPRYSWQRERFWLERQVPVDTSVAWRGARSRTGGGHPLLGHRLDSAAHASTHFWEADLDLEALPYLGDHRVQGTVVLPAAAHLEMALSAAAEVLGGAPVALGPVAFENAFFLAGPRRVQLVLTPVGPGATSFQLFSAEGPGGGSWTLHSSGTLRADDPLAETGSGDPLAAVRERCPEEIGAVELYAALGARGLEYGPAFQGIERLWRGDGEGLARVCLAPELAPGAAASPIHPALLDACFQAVVALLLDRDGEPGDGVYLPVALRSLRLLGRPQPQGWCHVNVRPGPSAGSFEGGLVLFDEEERPVIEARGLLIRQVAAGSAKDEIASWLYEVVWEEAGPPPPAAEPGGWLVLTGESGLGEALAAGLAARGGSCLVVRQGEEARFAAGGCQVRPGHAGDLERLVAWAGEALPKPWRGVAHAWSLDEPAEGSSSALPEAAERSCWSATQLVQALAGTAARPRLLLATRGAQAVGEGGVAVAQAALWGLGRVIAYEHPELRCRLVDLPPDADASTALLAELLSDDDESQVAYRGGGRRLARWVRSRPQETGEAGEPERAGAAFGERPYRVEAAEPGLLDRVVLSAEEGVEPGPEEIVVRVHAAGLNFIDVMRASGIYPGQPGGPVPLGVECAGEVVAVGSGVDRFAPGDRVMAVVPPAVGSLRSYALLSESWAVRIPAGLDYAAAATVPMAFLTAYYSMVHLGRLAPGERVLIHSATGGVGLAALQIARQAGAEVFATAGSEEKRALLREMGLVHVMDSRSLSFADEVPAATGGEGVDMVVNSLAGEAVARGLSALRPYGRFLELGKRDIYANAQLGLLPFQRCLSYFAVDVGRLSEERKPLVRTLMEAVAGHLERGDYAPLPAEVFPVSQVEGALRRMAQARHVGKLVLSFEETRVEVEVQGRRGIPVRADGTYLITGGLGGLGLEVAGWLAGRGARHLALLGRSAPPAAAREVIGCLEREGVRVLILQADVAREDELRTALARLADAMPPLAGVVHAAGILDDKTVAQLDRERLRAVLAPKVRGGWNLHRLTREAPLDFFVLFSSLASVLGSPGQGNYSAANSFLDALAHDRRRHGLPALAINWGAWSDVGLAARPDRGGRLAQRGLASLRPDQGIAALARLFERDDTQIAVTPFDLARWRQFYPAVAGLPLFSGLAAEEERPAPAPALTGREAILQAAPAERRDRVEIYLRDLIARVLGLSPAKLDLHFPINRMGIDSLMAVEVRNRVDADLGVPVPVVSLLQGPTVVELADQLLDRLAPASPPAGAGEMEAGGFDSLLDGLDRLSESQVDALLGDLLAEGEVVL